MADPNIILKVEAAAELSVRQVSAYEHIGQPFVLEVTACSKEPRKTSDRDPDRKGACIKLEDIAGRGAALRVQQDDGMHKVWTGICSHVEQVRFDETPGAESTYYLRIVPYLWLLSQRRNHRIFQHQTVPDIVKAVFEEWHLKYEFQIDQAIYPKKEYCTQYGERDLDFVHRMLEEAGISYFFEERDVGGGKAQSYILLADEAHTHPSDLDIPYASNPNEVHGSLYVTNVHVAHRVATGLQTQGDYNFRKPIKPLFAASEKAPDPEGKREKYEYEPGGFLLETGAAGQGPGDEAVADDKSTTTHDAEQEGKLRAQRFLEAERHKKRHVSFESSAQNLGAGKIITITDHPLGELQGQTLLIIESLDHLDASGEWHNVSEAVFTDVPYRMPRVTAKPQVAGVQSAIVVGPKGEEIYSDEFGRARVRFHWDREGAYDDTSTCWLRVSHSWAGAQYGMMMVPRIGHEVIVDFLDGDPDQPIIVGRVYNQPSPAAYKLPDHKTRSTWQSNSTPSDKKSKNFNEIMFEDQAGDELMFVQAERNYMSLVKRTETERTGEKHTSVVGKYRLGVVGNVDSVHAGKQHLIQMVKTGNLKIEKMGDPKTSARDTWIEIVDKKITLTTGKSTVVLDGPTITVEAKKGVRMSADKSFIIQGGPMVFLNAKGAGKVDVDAEKKIDDEAPVPEGRVRNSIIQLFGDPTKLKDKSQDKEIAVKAYIAHRDDELSKIVGKDVYVPDDPEALKADHAKTRRAIKKKIGRINVGSPRKARKWKNSATTTDQLHEDSKAAEPMLKDIVQQSADAAGGEANFGPEGKFAVKAKDSLERKAKDRPVSKISDGVRGTVIVDSPDQIPGAVDALEKAVKANGGQIVVDNKFAQPSDSGYGAVHADLLLPTADGKGTVRSEVQVHLRSLHDGTDGSIKEQSHSLYEKTRDKDLNLSPDQIERADQASMMMWQGGMTPHT